MRNNLIQELSIVELEQRIEFSCCGGGGSGGGGSGGGDQCSDHDTTPCVPN